MDCHANALAAACAFACHKTSWLVRHGPRPLVLGFPTSPSTSATSSSTFSAHAPPGGSNDSRLPRPGLAQGGEAAVRGLYLARMSPLLTCQNPLLLSAPLCCLVLSWPSEIWLSAPVATPSTSSTSMSTRQRRSVSAARLGCLLRRQNAAAVLCASWVTPQSLSVCHSSERLRRAHPVSCPAAVLRHPASGRPPPGRAARGGPRR